MKTILNLIFILIVLVFSLFGCTGCNTTGQRIDETKNKAVENVTQVELNDKESSCMSYASLQVKAKIAEKGTSDAVFASTNKICNQIFINNHCKNFKDLQFTTHKDCLKSFD